MLTFFNAEFCLVVALMLLILVGAARGRFDRFADFNRESTVPLRAVLACCVISSHVPPCQFLDLGTAAVSVFFFMSGYGIVKSCQTKKDYLHGMFWRNCRKLLVPYVICSIPFAVRFTIGGCNLSGVPYDNGYLLESLAEGRIPFLPNGWFPWALLAFSLIASVSLRIPGVIGCLACLTMIAMYYMLVRFGFGWSYYWWISTWAFPVGVLYAKHENTVINVLKRHQIVIPLAFMGLYSGIYLSVVLGGMMSLLEFAHALLPIVVVIAVCLYPLPRWKWLVFVGDVSYEIYLAHGVLFCVLIHLRFPVALAAICVYLLTPLVGWFVKKISGMLIVTSNSSARSKRGSV